MVTIIYVFDAIAVDLSDGLQCRPRHSLAVSGRWIVICMDHLSGDLLHQRQRFRLYAGTAHGVVRIATEILRLSFVCVGTIFVPTKLS